VVVAHDRRVAAAGDEDHGVGPGHEHHAERGGAGQRDAPGAPRSRRCWSGVTVPRPRDSGVRPPPGMTPDQTAAIVRRLDRNEYKRWQAPLVLRVSSNAFGAGRRLPIIHWYALQTARNPALGCAPCPRFQHFRLTLLLQRVFSSPA
jgi:hypothetical protein